MSAAPSYEGGPTDLSRSLKDIEREYILAVYEACARKKKPAAERLGISLRTLYNKLAEYSREREVVERPS